MLSRLASTLGILILSPVYLTVCIIVLVELGRPVLFFQTRVGRNYKPFLIWKFRTMQGGRTTAVTRWLRRSRLDELPQLINIMRGDMAFIGPRPEVPKFVTQSDIWSKVLAVKPGLFDPASLSFLDEERLLDGAADPEQVYRTRILREKLALSAGYLSNRSSRRDIALLIRTAWQLLQRMHR